MATAAAPPGFVAGIRVGEGGFTERKRRSGVAKHRNFWRHSLRSDGPGQGIRAPALATPIGRSERWDDDTIFRGATMQRVYEVLDRPEVVSVLFYPRRDVGVPRLASGMHTVRLAVAPGVHVGGKIFAAAEAGAPVILYFHGNGEIASDYDTIAPFYTRLGLTLFVVDYRGYGLSEGTPTATSLIDDAWAAYSQCRDVLTDRRVQAGELFIMGRSLGSAAALEIVDRAKDGIAGLILESGFAYTFPLIERIGFLQLADAYEHKDGFGNIDKIARATLPTLIIHGERDWIIPISDAEALYEASAASNKTLVRIPGAGHNDLMLVGRQAYFDAIASFCGTALQPEAKEG